MNGYYSYEQRRIIDYFLSIFNLSSTKCIDTDIWSNKDGQLRFRIEAGDFFNISHNGVPIIRFCIGKHTKFEIFDEEKLTELILTAD